MLYIYLESRAILVLDLSIYIYEICTSCDRHIQSDLLIDTSNVWENDVKMISLYGDLRWTRIDLLLYMWI